MTVAAELAKGAQRMEYILCVEGIGWPGDIDDLSTAWTGSVITTADLDGDLATVLGCTVKKGLMPPDSFGDSLDPVTLEHSPGGADFEIVNTGLWLDDVIRPRQTLEKNGTYYAGALMADLTFQSTTVDIDQSNPGGKTHSFLEDEVIWVGGREAILLGSRAAQGDGYRYTGCTRGYLGTPRGNWVPAGAWHGQHTFPEDTIVYPWNPFWHNRRVILYAHVPGEVRANCVRIFSGRVTGYRRVDHGVSWVLAATALEFPGKRRKWVPLPLGLSDYDTGGMDANTGGGTISAYVRLGITDSTNDPMRGYAIYYLYRYREAPGGADLDGSTATLPQAATLAQDFSYADDVTTYLSGALIKTSDGAYARLLYGDNRLAAGNGNLYKLVIDKRPLREDFDITQTISDEALGKPVTALLDNILDEAGANRFTVNGTVRRNIIDTALILLTSCDAEFHREDAAAGGTTTTINFTTGWIENEWAGYALHCVEGDNKGEARKIISNGDGDGTIVVDTPFGSATHSGNEYQIRNSIYDVLPIGWGLQVHNKDIDISSFETVRDQYLPNAETGYFVLGDDPDTDYWDLIVENLFRPYGVLAYLARATGKLSARYLFSLTTDATFETIVSVGDDDLMPGSFETVDVFPRSPVSRIEIYTRTEQQPGVGEPIEQPLILAAADAEISYEMITPDALEISALLNDQRSIGDLAELNIARLFSLYSPPYEAPCILTGRQMLNVQAGSILSVTTDKSGVKDPSNGSDGLASVPCRVLSSAVKIDPENEFLVDTRVQMLRSITSARIAPACDLTDIVTAGDPDYFEIDTDAFVDEASDYSTTDMMLFAVGDRIAHRAKDGSVTGGPYVIESFGTNEAATPTAANSARINTVGAIAGAFTAGDYVTFYAWGDDATANQELHSHYADATDEELGDGDSPKEYL